jgi:transcriptional regulator with XRE-family HTH domain
MRDGDQLTPAQRAALEHARQTLDVHAEVGLALRDHRRRLRMSQRAYARFRGLHRSMVARLEAGRGDVGLETAVDALRGTGFALFVGVVDEPSGPGPGGAAARADETPPTPPGPSPRRLPASAWEATDLVARVRGGGRRFPAHRRVSPVSMPPPWWWVHEFFAGPSEEPQWYAPVVDVSEPESWPEGAASRDPSAA